MGDKKGNGGFALLCCFIALGVSAVIAFITYLLPIVSDVTVGDNVMNILDIVLSVVTLLITFWKGWTPLLKPLIPFHKPHHIRLQYLLYCGLP